MIEFGKLYELYMELIACQACFSVYQVWYVVCIYFNMFRHIGIIIVDHKTFMFQIWLGDRVTDCRKVPREGVKSHLADVLNFWGV